jgi:Skp family chaperone for outer membrane proteins
MKITHSLLIVSCMTALSACGLAETAAVGATGAGSAAEQAKQAQQTTEKVRDDLAAAQQAAQEKLDAAEAAVE